VVIPKSSDWTHLIGTSYANLTGLEVVYTGIGQKHFPGIPKDLLPKSLTFLNLEGCSIPWTAMNYNFEKMATLRLHNLHGNTNASHVFKKLIRPSEHMFLTACLDRSLVDFKDFSDWITNNGGHTHVGIQDEESKIPRFASLGPAPVLLVDHMDFPTNNESANDSDQAQCSDDDDDDDDEDNDDFALEPDPHFDHPSSRTIVIGKLTRTLNFTQTTMLNSLKLFDLIKYNRYYNQRKQCLS
jgi:hypothetical protein